MAERVTQLVAEVLTNNQTLSAHVRITQIVAEVLTTYVITPPPPVVEVVQGRIID